jgi:RimJ/RimL family protein N-acetyltransferase
MTEAVGTLTKMLRETLAIRRIQIKSDTKNHRSRRVAELAGFQFEGILRHDSLAISGALRDTCVFSLVTA